MVINTILSRYQDGPFPWAEGERKISSGPLYPPAELMGLLAAGAAGISLLTRKCIKDVEDLALDHDALAAMVVEGLRSGRFIGSEWCQGSKEGQWLACDAYCFGREQWIAKANKHMRCEYYFKLAISKTGQVVLIVSFHLQR